MLSNSANNLTNMLYKLILTIGIAHENIGFNLGKTSIPYTMWDISLRHTIIAAL